MDDCSKVEVPKINERTKLNRLLAMEEYSQESLKTVHHIQDIPVTIEHTIGKVKSQTESSGPGTF